MLSNVLVVALAGYAGCTVIRFFGERMNLVFSSMAKLGVAAVCSSGFAAVLLTEPEDVVVVSLAGLGGATLVHRLHRLLGALGDRARLDVLQGSMRRR
jgi:hypothetical protein